MKNIALFNPPSGNKPHIKVAINAKCNSVKIPAKLINNLSLWFLNLQASVVSV